MCENDLSKWIEGKRIIQKKIDIIDEENLINEIVRAFSEYICAVDQEYQYNKNYLNGFIEYFIESIKKLREKKKYMQQLLETFDEYKGAINIDIDGAWIYEGKNDQIILSSCFDKQQVNANKLRLQIKHLETPAFVIAKTIDIADHKKIEEVKNLFENRLIIQNDDTEL